MGLRPLKVTLVPVVLGEMTLQVGVVALLSRHALYDVAFAAFAQLIVTLVVVGLATSDVGAAGLVSAEAAGTWPSSDTMIARETAVVRLCARLNIKVPRWWGRGAEALDQSIEGNNP